MSIMDDAKDDAKRRKQASQHMRELEESWREKVRSLVSPELPKILAILEGVRHLEPEFRFLELTARQEVKFFLSESIDPKWGLPPVPRFLWDSHHRIKVYTCAIDLSLVGGFACMVEVHPK